MKISFDDIALAGDILPTRLRYGVEVDFNLVLGGVDYKCTYNAEDGIMDQKASLVDRKKLERVYHARAVAFIRKFTDQPICDACGAIGPDVQKYLHVGACFCNGCEPEGFNYGRGFFHGNEKGYDHEKA